MPPAPALPLSVTALADRCVQCGLCLPACPTYRIDRIEAESPRGRIALARAWDQGTGPTPDGEAHLDHCLGCRACEAACPAHVDFGTLLVAARTQQRSRRPVPATQRAIEALVTRPRLLDAALRLLPRLGPALPRTWRLPPPPPARVEPAVPAHATARVALFTGCVARPYETPVRAALARVCAALDVALDAPVSQACCGSLHAHAGDAANAAALAARNAAAFAGHDRVLTLASGCHEAVARALPMPVEDAMEFLAPRMERLPLRPLPRRIGLHLPCTQRNLVRSEEATRAVLARIPGLEVVALDAGTGCCGSAGTAMLLEPARAAELRVPLLRQARESGVEAIASANIGCRLHLANGTALPVVHPIELVADALDTVEPMAFVDSIP